MDQKREHLLKVAFPSRFFGERYFALWMHGETASFVSKNAAFGIERLNILVCHRLEEFVITTLNVEFCGKSLDTSTSMHT